MEIADGRSVRDTGREVKRTYRLTRRRETPQTERPGNRGAKSLDIDKFILLDRAKPGRRSKPDGETVPAEVRRSEVRPGTDCQERELEKNLKKVLDKQPLMWYNPKCQDGKQLALINLGLRRTKKVLDNGPKV